VFYGGAIGRDVVHTVHDLPLVPGATLVPRPGSMTLTDLEHYRAPYQAPNHVRYRGYDVYSMAPSWSGGTTVGEALNILSNFDLGAESGVQVLHHYLEATRLAFADCHRHIGDRRYVQVPEASCSRRHSAASAPA
jgi:gamma-glutamyltranspeptidase / glutathione hydrolase